MKPKEPTVAVTVWIRKSIKEAADDVVERRGDLTRMIETGLEKEVAAKKLLINQLEAKAS